MRRKLQGRGFESRPAGSPAGSSVGRACPQKRFPASSLASAPLVGKCRRNYSLLSSWSRVRVPPLPLQWQGSSAVEHENVSPTLVVRSRQMPKGLHSRVANVQVRVLLLPCRIVQWVETRPLISSILVVGLLSFWCGGFIGAPQPFYE